MLKNNIRKLTKKPTLDFNNMSPFHAYILKKKKTHQNFRPKQTYSSFIMKMLDETPTNFNKTVKKISATTYKNLLKKNTSYHPLNTTTTNYSLTKRSTMSPFEKKLNKVKSEILSQNETSKESNTNSKSNIQPKKLILYKYNSNLNCHEPYYSPKKEIKIKNSFNNIRRRRLDNLYGYDSNFIKSKNNLLRKKDSFELESYQNEVLKISHRNLSNDYMMKLFTELKFIKNDADLVKPLPPINYHALVTHCFKEKNDKKNQKEKSKENKKMDEYEKELSLIKKSYGFKIQKTKRNKRLHKIYEILPEYVINALYKKKKKHINI